MKTFEVKDLPENFSKLNIIDGDTLLIHSSIFQFGKPSIGGIIELNEIFFRNIRDIIGPHGTIAVPTFNFDFCNGFPYDRQHSPSKGMGIFSEFIRKLPDSRRSYHPMQSLSVIGKHRDFIIEKDTKSSFEAEGPFDRIKQLEGKILLLGADFNTVSMVHWIEEKYSVPYRYWKSFSGIYVDQGIPSNRTYKMFVRSEDADPVLEIYRIEKELIKRKKLKEVLIGGGNAKIFDVVDFIEIAEDFIKTNPYFFVSNHPGFGES